MGDERPSEIVGVSAEHLTTDTGDDAADRSLNRRDTVPGPQEEGQQQARPKVNYQAMVKELIESHMVSLINKDCRVCARSLELRLM